MKVTFIGAIIWASLASAAAGPDACAQLANFQYANVLVYGATYITAGTNASVGTGYQVVKADCCRLQYTILTSNQSNCTSETWLPTTYYNRHISFGNGGWGGVISYSDLADGAYRGLASCATNIGHNATTNASIWAVNPESTIDYGWRALHVTTEVSKAVTQAYYGSKAAWNYYRGCSTGGRMGLKEIQFFPDSFDAILIGSPVRLSLTSIGLLIIRHTGIVICNQRQLKLCLIYGHRALPNGSRRTYGQQFTRKC